MRSAVSMILIVVLLACPALCLAEAVGHGAAGHGAVGSSPGLPATPGPCQDEGRSPQNSGENCICGGAVKADTCRVEVSDTAGLPSVLPAILNLDPTHRLRFLTQTRSPCGPASLGDPPTVRSFLQVFRC